MKVFFYSGMSGSPWGGSEDLWSRAALRLSDEGHTVHACVKAWPHPVKHVDELEARGVQVHRRQEVFTFKQRAINILARKAGIEAPYSPQVKLRSLLQQVQPDLVVVSQGGISGGLPAMEVAQQLHFPYVSLAQANSESFWPNDKLADRLLRAATLARQNLFVAKDNRDLFFRQIGQKLENCAIVYNPPNPTAEYDGSWPETDVELSLACVARLDTVAKGQDLIFEVLAQPQWHTRSVRLHLYGRGMNPKSLRRHAANLGIDNKVVFEGHVADIAKIWAMHHALILPSRYEGTPLSLIEAMRCGRPIICTAVAGMPELVQDNINGFIAEAPTIHHLSQCMERAWSQRNNLRSLGETAKTTINTLTPIDPINHFNEILLSLK